MYDRLTRVDVQQINSDGNYENVVMITDHESIELLRTPFEKVRWEPNTKAEMSRKEDVLATLFFELDKICLKDFMNIGFGLIVTILISNNERNWVDRKFLFKLKKRVLNIWKSRTICFILIYLLFFLPNDGFACSCDFPDTAQESVELSDQAFIGKVLSIQQERTTNAFLTNIQFEVQDAIKNVDTKVLTLKDDVGSCSIQFKVGSNYIVYANYATLNKQTKEYLKASYCLGTRNVYTAIDDLYELKAWVSLSKIITMIVLIPTVIVLIIVAIIHKSKKRKLV